MRQHLPGVAREQGEQLELDRRQVDRCARDHDLVSRSVDPDRADDHHGIIDDGRGAGMPEGDADPARSSLVPNGLVR